MEMIPRRLVQIHGMPPWLSFRGASGIGEASGQAQGGPADASVGMTIHNDDRGSWAWNALEGQWMLLHIIVGGDTLWNLTARYYGPTGQNLVSVRRIGNIPQNAPILGSDYRDAVPGDVILIPDLEQPGASPPSPPGGGAEPAPGGDPTPGPGDPPISGGLDPIGGLPAEPPPGWPPTMPWPPFETDPGGDEPTNGEPATGAPSNGAEPILVGGAPAAAVNGANGETWWTTGRIALVGGIGVATVALIVWGATRGTKRRRRSPRRTPRRRRR
ncbi:MAG: hypothetical protein ACYSU7_06910 [Planctomycetota bacterium]|jgi:hypothetical protein